MSAEIYRNGHAVKLRHAPQYFLTSLPVFQDGFDPIDILRYFRVTQGMLVEYIMGMWPLIITCGDDELYQYICEEVDDDSGIFHRPEDSSQDEDYYYKFEALYRVIYTYVDHFKRFLNGMMDPTDEHDKTQFFSVNTMDPFSVMIGVQKEFEL